MVGGITVPVAQGGHSQEQVPLGIVARSYGGWLRSAITSTRGHVRVWTITTPLLDRADAATLESTLIAPGRVTANGTLVGGSAVTCYAVGVERREDKTLLYATLTFRLLAAS